MIEQPFLSHKRFIEQPKITNDEKILMGPFFFIALTIIGTGQHNEQPDTRHGQTNSNKNACGYF